MSDLSGLVEAGDASKQRKGRGQPGAGRLDAIRAAADIRTASSLDIGGASGYRVPSRRVTCWKTMRFGHSWLVAAALLAIASDGAGARTCDGVTLVTEDASDRPAALAARGRAERGTSARTLVIGDSIANRWPEEMLGALFGHGRIEKLAVGGGRLENLNAVITSMPPSATVTAVLLVVGTNNINRDSACEFEGRFRALLESTRKAAPNARIVVVDLLPKGIGLRAFREKILTANQFLSRHSKEFGFTLVNVHEPVDLHCKGNTPCDVFLTDNVHPSTQGYKMLTDIISRSIVSRAR